jgi:hypothetical protein
VPKLLLPLHHYDESGRVKPASSHYWLSFYLSRSLLIALLALSDRQHSSELLRLIYPQQQYLYWGIGVGLPAVLGLLILTFREKLTTHRCFRLFTWLKPSFTLAAILDICLHLYLAKQHLWQFSWVIALSLLFDLLSLLYILRDKHLSLFVRDWRHP